MQAGEGEAESDTMVRPSGPRSSPYGAHRGGGGGGGLLSGRSNRVLLLVVGLIVVGLFGELRQLRVWKGGLVLPSTQYVPYPDTAVLRTYIDVPGTRYTSTFV